MDCTIIRCHANSPPNFFWTEFHGACGLGVIEYLTYQYVAANSSFLRDPMSHFAVPATLKKSKLVQLFRWTSYDY
jgi:hypothetical protein